MRSPELALPVQFGGFVLTAVVTPMTVYLIATKTRPEVGNYKTLLIVFSLLSFVMSLSNFLLQPVLHAGSVFFFVFCSSWFSNNRDVTTNLFVIYAFCIGAFASLLCLQFFYCYVKASRPATGFLRGWRLLPWAIPVLLVAILTAFVASLIVPSPITELYTYLLVQQYYDDDVNKLGYLGSLVYLKTSSGPTRLLVNAAISLFFISFLLIILLGVVLYYAVLAGKQLNQSDPANSEKSSRLQKELLAALIIQTLLAFVFIYGPLLTIVLAPILSTDVIFGQATSFFYIFFTFHLALQQLVLLFVASDYRTTILCGAKFKCAGSWKRKTAAVRPAEPVDVPAQVEKRKTSTAHPAEPEPVETENPDQDV